MPPMPITETTRTLPSRPVACRTSLRVRSSSARPTNGGSIAIRFWPWRSATTRSARQAGTCCSLPFRVSAPAGSKAIAPAAAR